MAWLVVITEPDDLDLGPWVIGPFVTHERALKIFEGCDARVRRAADGDPAHPAARCRFDLVPLTSGQAFTWLPPRPIAGLDGDA